MRGQPWRQVVVGGWPHWTCHWTCAQPPHLTLRLNMNISAGKARVGQARPACRAAQAAQAAGQHRQQAGSREQAAGSREQVAEQWLRK